MGRWYNCFDKKFDTTNFMIWHKTNPAPKIFKAGFLNSCEMIFTCWNKKHTWNFISQKEMHNFIETPICMRPERLANPKHPAQKPVKVLEKLIRIASNEDDIIFDPFMGVGSVGVAAMKLKRKFIGIEIDETYCKAAVARINKELEMKENKAEYEISSETVMVKEPDFSYMQEACAPLDTVVQKTAPKWIIDIERSVKTPEESVNETLTTHKSKTDKLRPLLKWPGGKEKELKYILPLLPDFENYYEPFVGGGSVFAAMKAKKYFVNDKSEALIGIYNGIAKSDEQFFFWLDNISSTWRNMFRFAQEEIAIKTAYKSYRTDEINETDLFSFLQSYLSDVKKTNTFSQYIADSFHWHRQEMEEIFEKNIKDKMRRMKKIELERGFLSENDVQKNIETAYMSTLYTYFRMLYNDKKIASETPSLHTSLFLFLRYYAYSGMFRYNDKGEFNVPYGGMSYNKKSLQKEIDYYKSESLLEKFRRTTVFCLDFEEFFYKFKPKENDFIFLDPPYDSDFSTY
ncbi:DNA adenine methylase, partial [Prevotella falsenii]|uniref:DNA adenine methylase n=1 Tax=Prevotella falsenii TaxID=515414 RepID=UPI003570EE3D